MSRTLRRTGIALTAMACWIAAPFAAAGSEEPALPSIAAEPSAPLLERGARWRDFAVLPDGLVLATDGTGMLQFLDPTGQGDANLALTLNPYYAPSPMLVTADGSHALIADQWIDLKQRRLAFELRITEAVERAHPGPEPMDLSPGGERALVLLHSRSDAHLTTLAVFDLDTARPTHRVYRGADVTAAVFAGDEAILLIHHSGRITTRNLAGEVLEELHPAVHENDSPYWRLDQSLRAEERHLLLVSAADRSRHLLFDVTRRRVMLEMEDLDHAVLDRHGDLLLTRAMPEAPKGSVVSPYQVRRLPSGQAVAEITGLGWTNNPQFVDTRSGELIDLELSRTLRRWTFEPLHTPTGE